MGQYNHLLMTLAPHSILTAEQLLLVPGDQRCELVKGELISMAPAGFDHGAIISNLQFLLVQHVKKHRLGVVLGAETGFLLARNPDTVRAADIAFVTAVRVPAGPRPEGYFPGAPDLAVEVVSPRDTLADVEDKVDDYLKAGSSLVWVINPRRRTVTVHRPNQPPTLLRDMDTLADDTIIAGFACAVSEIFA